MNKTQFTFILLAMFTTGLFSQRSDFAAYSLNQNMNEFKYENFKDTLDALTLQKAKEIANRIIIIDCHSHNLFQTGSEGRPKQVSFSMLKESGINGIVQSFPLDIRAIKNPSQDILKNIQDTKKRIVNESLEVSFVINSNDFISTQKNDSVKIMLGLEYFNGIFDGNIDMLQKYYREGVREIGLVRIGGLDTLYANNDLTEYGINLIKEINGLGIICDITHMIESAQLKVIEASKAPVILSHTNSFTVVNSGFNATDTVLEKLTAKGGIICVTFFSGQLSMETLEYMESEQSLDQLPRASIDDLINQIDFLKEKVGIDFIGIGSDYGGSGRYAPQDLETIEGFPLIIYHLLKRGYTENEIEKIMGLNFIRFYERVEKTVSIN